MIWVSILLLVLISGTLSSSETALFKLDEGERALASPRVRRLLEDPRSLLVTILLGNLIVNLAFFAVAPSALGRFIERSGGLSADEASFAGGFGALVILLITGEILPKAVALRAPRAVARLTSAPVTAAVRTLGPARLPSFVTWPTSTTAAP